MLEETIDRLDFLKPEDIYIAINEKHLKLTKSLAPQIPESNIIIEPDLRDTASCIGYAAAIIDKNHPDEVMAVIYADHLIQNKVEFAVKLQAAEKVAQKHNTLNIIEVPALSPNTNYGYAKIGKSLETIDDSEIYELLHFEEKPSIDKAKQFVKDDSYLWNTGIYVWKAKTLLEKYQQYQPETFKVLQKIQNSLNTGKSHETISSLYPTLEKISIDYAIIEKVDPSEFRILKANLGWSDIGNFEAIYEELATSDQNITRGDVKTLETSDSLIYADTDKPIKVIGLKDVVIVDTPEGLLVCDKNQAKRVKEI